MPSPGPARGISVYGLAAGAVGLSFQPLGPEDLTQVFDSLREGVQVIDREWRYAYLNTAAALHGRTERTDLVGRTITECYPGIDETEMFRTLRACMDHGTPGQLENEFVYPDGSRRTFELRVEPCDIGIVVLSIDVSDGRRLEAQLRHAQKMEAIGRLSGSVAHDFNNLLSVILSYSTLLLADLKPLDPLRGDVESIKKAGERAADLTRQLLAFSRQQLLAPRVLDLNDVLQEAEKMLRRLLGESVELMTRYARGLSMVRVDPGQIDQVVLNLAINARDAMPTGGKLTIETADVYLDQSYASDHFAVKPGSYVMMAVTDTGTGMDKETQLRIFEPFFTTKERGKGTGLGLSTVFGIVQQSGGNIWVYSEPGRGTTFKIYLPKAAEPARSHSPSLTPPEPATLNGSETILLAEDQAEVRQVAAEVLRRFGYHVIEAQNAGEALLICERHPRIVHLLLTDVVMPHLTGHELAERLLKIRPEMKVLYMSGYTENAVIEHALIEPGVAYLQKPIRPEALARRVREVLDSNKPQSHPPPSR